jgi:hypothetical protein
VLPILPVPTGWNTDRVCFVRGQTPQRADNCPMQPRILDVLGAFFGPSYRDWWLSYAKDPEYVSPYHNHWLIRKSVAKPFAEGFVRLDRLLPSMVEVRHPPARGNWCFAFVSLTCVSVRGQECPCRTRGSGCDQRVISTLG